MAKKKPRTVMRCPSCGAVLTVRGKSQTTEAEAQARARRIRSYLLDFPQYWGNLAMIAMLAHAGLDEVEAALKKLRDE